MTHKSIEEDPLIEGGCGRSAEELSASAKLITGLWLAFLAAVAIGVLKGVL